MADWQILLKNYLKENDSSLKDEIGTSRRALKGWLLRLSLPSLPPRSPLQTAARVASAFTNGAKFHPATCGNQSAAI